MANRLIALIFRAINKNHQKKKARLELGFRISLVLGKDEVLSLISVLPQLILSDWLT